MLMVNAPLFRMFFTVLCPALRHRLTSFCSLIPPHAAFIASGVPSSPYVAMMNTGCGYERGFAPKFFLITEYF